MSNEFRSSNERVHDDIAHANHPLKGITSRRTFLVSSIAGATAAVPATLLVAQSAHAAARSTAWLSTEDAFQEIRRDEDDHVAFLKQALGSAARPKPSFKGLKQDDVNHFIQLSQVFENVGVGAYLMAAPAISSKGILAAAGSILTIEARHAGYLNSITDMPLSTNGAFDKPLSQGQIVKDVMPFLESLNGGPDPSKPLKNDIDILNFALLLEYLEATFYDTNVPRFYH